MGMIVCSLLSSSVCSYYTVFSFEKDAEYRLETPEHFPTHLGLTAPALF
jgi:hypothetical protein